MSNSATEPTFDVVGFIIDAESGNLSAMETLEGLGHLIRTGLISGLQGAWQRAAADAVEGDLLTPDGNLTDHALAALGDLDDTFEG